MTRPVTLTRRALLAGVLAGLGAGLAWGTARRVHPAQPASPIRRRWPTANGRLAPPGLAGDQVLFAGDRSVGTVSPLGSRPSWESSHGLAGPAVYRPRCAGGRVICGGPQEIACWSLEGGAPYWRYRARAQLGVPLVTARRTYLGDGHEVVAIDSQSGELLWRFATTPDTLVSYAPAISGETLLAAPGDGRLYALGAADGALQWNLDRRAEWQYLRQLQSSGDLLVAGGYRDKLYGISTADGSVVWSFHAGNFINSHCVDGESAYLWSPTGWIYAVDTATGAVRWRHRTTDYGDAAENWAAVMAELVVARGRLYALAMDQVLHVLDAATGGAQARLALPEPVRPAVLAIPDLGLVFAAAQGDLILLDDPA